MAQLEDRIPVDVSPGVAGGPEFKTTIKTLRGGGESRNQLWANPRRRYTTSYGNRDPQIIADELLTFLYKTRGSLHSFRAKDWSDYQVTGEAIATADGSDYWFRLTKAYSDYSRRILKPVAGSVSVTVDGVSVPASDYRIDTVNGAVVLFETPGVGEVVTWTGEFDVPVRFAEDAMDVVMDVHTSGHVESVGLIEVRARENIVEADYAVAQAVMPYSLAGELGMPTGVSNYVVADFKRGRYFKDGVETTFAALFPAYGTPTVGADGIVLSGTLTLPSGVIGDPVTGNAYVVQMVGKMTYADTGSFQTVIFYQNEPDVNNRAVGRLSTSGAATGLVQIISEESGNTDSVQSPDNDYTPGTDVPFNIVGLHAADKVAGASKGAIMTTGGTVTGMPAISASDWEFGTIGSLTIERLMIGSFPTTVATDSYLQGITA